MSDVTPTRSAVLELKEERRAMHDGYVFLDEKCLLLAAEILRELSRHETSRQRFLATYATAVASLQAAVARHGLHGLQVYPRAELPGAELQRTTRTLMGVRLQDVALRAEALLPAAAIDPSSEAETCRRAFAALLDATTHLAAVAGNLTRLSLEYRRSVRRAHALQDVLLPELDGTVADLETRLEEFEQEDAIWMRRRS
jgi:V/A-type H+/Na+-transporting ATPase subunit D